jgi:hypothetical protein
MEQAKKSSDAFATFAEQLGLSRLGLDKSWDELMRRFRNARNTFNLIDKSPEANTPKAMAVKMSILYSMEKTLKHAANDPVFEEKVKMGSKEIYETWEKLASKTKDPHGKTISSMSKLPTIYKWGIEGRSSQEEMMAAAVGFINPTGVMVKASKLAVDAAKAKNFIGKVSEFCSMMKLKYKLAVKPWKTLATAEKETIAEEVTEFARRNTDKSKEKLWNLYESSMKQDPISTIREMTHVNSEIGMEELIVRHGEDVVKITKSSVLNSNVIRTPGEWAKIVDAIAGTQGEIKGAVASKVLGTKLTVQYENLVVHCFRKPDVLAGIAKDAPYVVDRIEYAGGPLAGMFRPW